MDLLTNLSLFSGAGGLDLGARIVGGFRTVCYVEKDRYAQGVLMSRMRDGGLDEAPIWDDVTTFDGRPWRGLVDVVSGGFPCQDVSHAGKRAGLKEGTRSGLWSEFDRVICEVRPRFVLLENVPGLLSSGFGRVLGDLACGGYDASWFCLAASHVGAPHRRNRVWIIAYPFDTDTDKLRWDRTPIDFYRDFELRDEQEREPGWVREDVADSSSESIWRGQEHREDAGETEKISGEIWQQRLRSDPGASRSDRKTMADAAGKRRRKAGRDSERPEERTSSSGEILGDSKSLRRSERDKDTGRSSKGTRAAQERTGPANPGWWKSEPNVGRVAHGVAFRVDRLRCCGNGVVPLQSVSAWQAIKDMALSPSPLRERGN